MASTPESAFDDTQPSAFPSFSAPPAEPGQVVREWLRRGSELGVQQLRSGTLSTVSLDGGASARTVILVDVDDAGFLLTTALATRKVAELAANPAAALTFYWRETMQQLSVTGDAERIDRAHEDELWQRRQASDDLGRDAWGGYRIRPRTVEFWHEGEGRSIRRLLYSRTGTGWTTSRLEP